MPLWVLRGYLSPPVLPLPVLPPVFPPVLGGAVVPAGRVTEIVYVFVVPSSAVTVTLIVLLPTLRFLSDTDTVALSSDVVA